MARNAPSSVSRSSYRIQRQTKKKGKTSSWIDENVILAIEYTICFLVMCENSNPTATEMYRVLSRMYSTGRRKGHTPIISGLRRLQAAPKRARLVSKWLQTRKKDRRTRTMTMQVHPIVLTYRNSRLTSQGGRHDDTAYGRTSFSCCNQSASRSTKPIKMVRTPRP